jgi:tungstate transport system permease protein
MDFIWQGFREALHMIASGDPTLKTVLGITLRVALFSTFWALVFGLPAGVLLGISTFRGRRPLLALANGGMGLPPVVVGLFLFLLMLNQSPLGRFHLIYTVKGIIVAQTVLALPVVIALTAAAVQAVDPRLLDQARALGASRFAVSTLALREARVGVLAAAIAALGACLSEVGAVVLVGGNIQGSTDTLASAVLLAVSGGRYDEAIAYGTILLGLIFLLAAGLTLAQYAGAPARTLRRL